MLERLKEGIYRICIPFEGIYTSVFFLTKGNDIIILDSGLNNTDVNTYIIPEIEKHKYNVKYIVCSHNHGDHCGGMEMLASAFPDVDILWNVKSEIILFDRFKILNLKGHSDDSLGIFDLKTRTLLSCDSLQWYGVGSFGTIIGDVCEYLQSIEKLKKLGLKTIISSHNYYPYGSIIEEDKVSESLDVCIDVIKKIIKFTIDNTDLNTEDIAKLYNSKNKNLPLVQSGTIDAVKIYGGNIREKVI